MDMVAGALLESLLVLGRHAQYTLIRGRGVAGDLQFIKDELTSMQSFLDDLGEVGDDGGGRGHDHRMNDLMIQFCDLTYDIEDCIRDPGQLKRIHTPRQDKICCDFLVSSFLLTWRPRRDIANKIAKLKMCVQQMGELRHRYAAAAAVVVEAPRETTAAVVAEAEHQFFYLAVAKQAV